MLVVGSATGSDLVGGELALRLLRHLAEGINLWAHYAL